MDIAIDWPCLGELMFMVSRWYSLGRASEVAISWVLSAYFSENVEFELLFTGKSCVISNLTMIITHDSVKYTY